MDDLEFRRSVFAEPFSDDERMQAAAANDPLKQAFLNDVRQFDDKLKHALHVDVPEHLAERLILRQTIESHQQSRRRNKIHLALAASVAFAIGLSVQTLNTPFVQLNLGQHSLAHLDHEIEYLHEAQEVTTLEQVNLKLARFGGQFEQSVGKTVFANYCDFGGVTSLHLIYEDAEQNRITVFITPKDGNFDFVKQFSDEQYVGKSLSYEGAEVTVVSEDPQVLKAYSKKIDESLNWEI